MRFEASYELTDAMLDRVTRRFIVRHLNRRVAVIVVFYVLLLLLLCRLDESRWLCGLFSGAILLLTLLVGVAYFVRAREARAMLRKLPHRQIRWEIDDEALTRHSALGVVSWPWSFFDTLVVEEDYLMFLLKRQLNAFLPAAALTPEAAAFVRESMAAHGGKVVT